MELAKSTAVERKVALESLSFEIQNIQNTQAKNGINHWVLYATLGSFFWLFTSELQNTNVYSFNNSLIIFILISFSVDQYKVIHRVFIDGFNYRNIHNYKFDKFENIYKRRLIPILETATWTASLLLLKSTMPSYLFWTFFIYSISSMIFLIPLIIFITQLKDHIPPFDRSPIKHKVTNTILGTYQVILITTVGVGIFSLLSFYLFTFPKILSFTHSDWRIGALIFGTLFILNKLVSISDTDTLDSLRDIYRKLNLELIRPETAVSQMNLELAGYTSNELFQQNILKKFMVHLKNFEFLLQEQKVIYLSLKTMISKSNSSQEDFKSIEAKTTDFCTEKSKLIVAVERFTKEALKISGLFNTYKHLHLIDFQTVEEIEQSLKKEISRIQLIETDLLNSFKKDVMPSITECLEKNNIAISVENQKLLPK